MTKPLTRQQTKGDTAYHVAVNDKQLKMLRKMVDTGLYGESEEDVIRHLMVVGLVQFKRDFFRLITRKAPRTERN